MLNVGIIGCGFATRDRHLPALAQVAEANVVALADTDRAILTEVADRWNIRQRYPTAEALVADPAVEARRRAHRRLFSGPQE